MDKQYQICKRCVLDTSDPNIKFDREGVCNHCTAAIAKNEALVKQRASLDKLLKQIRQSGKLGASGYDCVIGVSGGVDSSYVAYLVKQWGLNPLAVHLDNRWNTEVSERNMEAVVKKLHIDLLRINVDWDEFKDLQLAFLKASVPDLEIPTDHALIAVLYGVAERFGIKFILSGHNTMTESIGVPTWSQGHYDWRYVRKIQKQFGTRKLKHFAHQGPWDVLLQKHFLRIKRVHILDYVDYDKKKALEILKKEFGFEEYRTKHSESVYTDFVQSYVLPTKFGYDKRRAHLSNLICAGQITRQDALDILANPPLTEGDTEKILAEVRTKLGLSDEELTSLLNLPNKHFTDYPSYQNHPVYGRAKKVYKKLK